MRLATAINPFAGAAASTVTSEAFALGGASDLRLSAVVTSASTFTVQLSNAGSPTETDWVTDQALVVASGGTIVDLPVGSLFFRVLRSNDDNTLSLSKNYR